MSSDACILTFSAADSILNFARDLVSLTLGLQLGVTCCLADGFLDRALVPLCCFDLDQRGAPASISCPGAGK
jgi:hypothetical protein